ncbi:alpha/beta hydrolase [Streptomyces sp. H39-S7]|uniref:alpha/beta hydrolase n=1 Tax=Streptomyces sp. H39-S7 TaxID=3004357 RepID=UPI0022AFE4D2|nr:alpha/beta hydrolase [Streptomyces sp. H39-S7]MCZ4121918.1 alpha/beta hydrolase [Streptomyces sp. H39-S7]
MTTYVLIPGAGCDPWYWHLVVPLLRERGHDVVAADLPCEDESAGLAAYTEAVLDAIGDRTDLVVVAHSLGGFTAPLVCERVPVDLMVLVAAMVPAPGESPGEWWDNTGLSGARREAEAAAGRDPDAPFDPDVAFLHDVPKELAAELMAEHSRNQADAPFLKPWPLRSWPQVPTRFLLCRHDRFLPAAFQRRVVRERLGFTPDEMDSGHLPSLSRPQDLVDRLEAYRLGLGAGLTAGS